MDLILVTMRKQTTPAANPMAIADIGETKPEAGVIATSPATAPEIAPRALGFPLFHHSTAVQPTVAAAAPNCVATNALVAKLPAPSALPALNPNHPTQSKQAPMKLKTTLCGGMDSFGYPRRGPRYNAHTSADTPDVMCTTVPPAKSRQGNRPLREAFSRPPFPQTMCAMGAYTTSDHSTMKAAMALNFMRSANAPAMSAGVMMANINWKTMNVWSGMVAA